MRTKSPIKKSFDEELKRILKRETKIAWRRWNRMALIKVIESHRSSFSTFAVCCKDFVPERILALHIGRVRETTLFYQKDNFYCSRKPRTSQEEIPLVEKCSFQNEWVSHILKFLDGQTLFKTSWLGSNN